MRTVLPHVGTEGREQGADGLPKVQEPVLEQAEAGEGEGEGAEVMNRGAPRRFPRAPR